MFADMMKGSKRKHYELVVLLIWFAFSFFLTWHGTRLLLFIIETGQFSAAMEMPMSWPYASVPVGCSLMCLRLIIEIYKLLGDKSPAVQEG